VLVLARFPVFVQTPSIEVSGAFARGPLGQVKASSAACGWLTRSHCSVCIDLLKGRSNLDWAIDDACAEDRAACGRLLDATSKLAGLWSKRLSTRTLLPDLGRGNKVLLPQTRIIGPWAPQIDKWKIIMLQVLPDPH
jgi:hypothetical protein